MAGKRRMYRKKAKKGGARKRKANTTQRDVHHYTVKQTTLLTPSQGLTVSNYLNVFVSPCPGDGFLANTVPLRFSTEMALYCQMYDQFRVNSVTIKVVPRATMTEQVNLALESDSALVTAGKQVYYTVLDRDGTCPSSISALKKYASVRTHKMTSTATRTYSIKSDGKDQWFDCQDRNALEDVQKSLGLWGGITLYGESFLEAKNQILNSPWADMEIIYNVSFRGKALVGIAVGDDGSVKVFQPDTATLDPVIVFLGNDSNDHFGSVDLSGNNIGNPVF